MSHPNIESIVSELLEGQGSFTSGELAARTGLSRQALHRHLSRWLEEGRLVREGRTRGARYRAPVAAGYRSTQPLAEVSETRSWQALEEWLARRGVQRTPEFTEALQYVVTELVNNALEHSAGRTLTVRADLLDARLELLVADDGVGAFENLRSRLGLEDHLHALQLLSKGKTTTLPERHTGEGLFFASRLVDRFELTANGLAWIVDNELGDQTVEEGPAGPGTQVRIRTSTKSRIAPTEVFGRFTHDFEFDTTRCVIHLYDYGVRLISRSEGKRVTQGLERFREAVLDFRGVESVGQGFVDEVFRVWATAHPEVRLIPQGMNRTVEFMVKRGLPSRSGGRPGA